MSKKPCKDHLGNEFESITAMCEYYGVNPSTFSVRLAYGAGLQEALGASHTKKQAVDHQGNKFNSIVDMCRHWGISQSVYYGRLSNGWSLRDALETPIGKRGRKCKDHVGNECKAHQGNKCKAHQGNKCKDHLGNEFDSIKDMYRHWGISLSIYYGRLNKGWSLRDTLETPVGKQGSKKCKDHMGNEFDSVKDMCNHYGVAYKTYSCRRYWGMSLKDALTLKTCEDHLGNVFSSIYDMCEHYGLCKGTLLSRLYNGWSLQEALETPVHGRRRK